MDNILPSGYTATVKEEFQEKDCVDDKVLVCENNTTNNDIKIEEGTNVNGIKIEVDNGPLYLVQCPFCNFYLGQQEYYEYHTADCCKRNIRIGRMEEVIQAPRYDLDIMNNQMGKLLLIGLQNDSNNEIISDMISFGCNINITDVKGNTPLHYAVKRDTIDIMRILVEMGADVNARNENGCTPLHIAARYSRLNVLEEVLRIQHIKVDDRNVSGETPLYLSLFENRPDDIVSALIDAGCSVNSANGWKKETPLHLAVFLQSEAIAYKLIEKGADINAQYFYSGLTPLHEAIINCSDEKFVSSLINLASDVNISDYTEYTPLHYAAYRESTFIARKLIEKGANVNFTNFEGDTLLHHAVQEGNLEYLCMLLYYNAPANETNLDGRTPFFETVCSYCHDENIRTKEIIQYLMNYVTDINQEDEDHITVLHRALMYGNDIALDILENGADVNKLVKGMHSLYSAWIGNTSYDVLKIIWDKTDFKIFLTSEVMEEDRGKSFLNIYCEQCLLPNDKFLKYLFMLFESPYIEDIVQPRCPEIQEFLIATIVWERDLTLEQSVEVLNVFLSFGVIVHFDDVRALYEVYGFDESLELLLMSGCYINPGVTDIHRVSPLIYRICYDDNLRFYEQFREMCSFTPEKSNNQEVITQDPEFYRGTPQIKNGKLILCCSAGEVRSLVEISRDVIRKRIYRKCTTCYSFNAFSAMSKLPVPITIRDILYLKRQIYANT